MVLQTIICDFEHSCAFSKKFPVQQESRFRLDCRLPCLFLLLHIMTANYPKNSPGLLAEIIIVQVRPPSVWPSSRYDKICRIFREIWFHVRKIADCLKLFNIFNCTFKLHYYIISCLNIKLAQFFCNKRPQQHYIFRQTIHSFQTRPLIIQFGI